MNKRFILSLLTLSFVYYAIGQETPQSEQSVSIRILQTYFQARKAHIAQHRHLYRDETPMEKALGKYVEGYAHSNDVEMKVVKEESPKNDYIIIITRILGNPEEFEGKAVLENEKEFFKFFIIDAYRKKLAEDNQKNRNCGMLSQLFNHKRTSTIVILDKETKVTMMPQWTGRRSERLINEAYVVDERKHMTLKTVVPFSVFEEQAKHHFV